jgi:hypothetical protein
VLCRRHIGDTCAVNSRWLNVVDHLVYATPNLAATVADLEAQLGLSSTPGGQHPGRGTQNSLFALGAHAYLEVIGPDQQQPEPASPRWFAIDSLAGPKLVAWAAKSSRLDDLANEASGSGIKLGPISSGSRKRPDGGRLDWRFTDPSTLVADGIFPFFIDWGTSRHPAADIDTGCRLDELRAEHPDAETVSDMLQFAGIGLQVAAAAQPALIATVTGALGSVELR